MTSTLSPKDVAELRELLAKDADGADNTELLCKLYNAAPALLALASQSLEREAEAERWHEALMRIERGGIEVSDLIERLEKATGADRELDAEIWMTLNPSWRDYSRTEAGGWITPLAWSTPAEHYTDSIDAALTLVPEGWNWRVSGPDWDKGKRTSYFGYVREYRKAGDPRREAEGDGRHTMPAIALCIAALKARAAIKDTQ